MRNEFYGDDEEPGKKSSEFEEFLKEILGAFQDFFRNVPEELFAAGEIWWEKTRRLFQVEEKKARQEKVPPSWELAVRRSDAKLEQFVPALESLDPNIVACIKNTIRVHLEAFYRTRREQENEKRGSRRDEASAVPTYAEFRDIYRKAWRKCVEDYARNEKC